MHHRGQFEPMHPDLVDGASADLLNKLPTPVVVYCPTRETLCPLNEGARRLLGLETVGTPIAAADVFADSRDHHRIFRYLSPDGSVNEFEALIRRGDGQLSWLSFAARADRIAGEPVALAVLKDITRRKDTEKALQESERHYRELFDGSLQGIVIHQGFQPLFANQAYAQLLGYSDVTELLCNGSLKEIIPPEQHAVAQEIWSQLLADGKPRVVRQTSNVRRDGQRIWVDVMVSRITWRERPAVQSSIVDVTDSKLAYDALRQSEQRYESVISVLGEGIIIQDAQGRMTSCNASAMQMLGCSEHTLINHPEAVLGKAAVDENGSPLPLSQYPGLETLRTGKARQRTVVGVHAFDGSFKWLAINTQPIFADGDDIPRAVVSSFRDITERKRIEEELQRLATVDDLTGALNRRAFKSTVQAEYSRARRYGHPLGMVLMDVDHFKRINDQFGHDTGDRVLQTLVEVCRRHLRESDVLGRWGGEEFGILLPETALATARQSAERIGRALAEIRVEADGQTIGFTASLGVAQMDDSMSDIDELFKAADVALYQAKKAGRNRVETALKRTRQAPRITQPAS